MKTLTAAILVTAVAIASTSCRKENVGEGPIKTEVRSVPEFSGIDLRMNGNVYYTNSPERKVEVSAKESIHGMLETTVSDNRLVIRYKNGRTYDADESIRINISGPEFGSFVLNTSGSIYVMNDINPSTLWLRTGGSGSIMLKQVNATLIDAESSVSGHITATGGSATTLKARTNASGKIEFYTVAVKSASAEIVGSGDISTKVSDNVDVTIKGSGSVYLMGNPFVTTHISGTGKLIRF